MGAAGCEDYPATAAPLMQSDSRPRSASFYSPRNAAGVEAVGTRKKIQRLKTNHEVSKLGLSLGPNSLVSSASAPSARPRFSGMAQAQEPGRDQTRWIGPETVWCRWA